MAIPFSTGHNLAIKIRKAIRSERPPRSIHQPTVKLRWTMAFNFHKHTYEVFCAGSIFDQSTQPHIVTLIALASISALAMNIFLPSLPSMAAYYNTTPSVMSLSVAIYLGASALLQLFSGPTSDRIGRRPVILVSLGLFIIASLATIWAPNAETFRLKK